MISASSNQHAAAGCAPCCLLLVLLSYLLPSASAVSFHLPNLSNRETANISYAGDASPTDDGIQLTKVTYGEIHTLFYSTGRAAYSQPIPLWDSATKKLASFTTNFSFFIGNVAQKNKSGDGVAFFIAANGTFIPDGAIGGYLALYSNDTISPSWGAEAARRRQLVAVEFDTYPNPWDPKHMHFGIDVASIESVNHTYWTEYTDNTINTTVSATVTYEAKTKKLSAWMVDGEGRRATVSYVINLTEVLPGPYMYVGFSAATGENVEHHRLLNWSFYSDLDRVSIMPPGSSTEEGQLRGRGSKSMSTRFMVALGVAAGSGAAWLTIFFTGVCFWLYFLRRSRSIDPIREIGPKEFRYRDLRDATANFTKARELGRGSFGVVYRGTLNDADSTDVAVKKFTHGSAQGRQEYTAEVTVISRIRHRNLVKLLGWCHERGDFLLVYEFMPNRSLDYHLFPRPQHLKHNRSSSSDHSSSSSLLSSFGVLPWITRYKVAVDIASAIHYLHDECERYVIHRDIKPSNILLDMNLNAKLGDFGLARMVTHGLSVSSAVLQLAGTPGYVAPECFTTLRSTKQSDIYSFGVVAVEIATGRSASRTIQEEPDKTEGLLSLVWESYEAGNLAAVADKNLNMEFETDEMERLLKVGLWCASRDPAKRPSIGNVLAVLKLEMPLPFLPPRTSPHGSSHATLNIDCTTSSMETRMPSTPYPSIASSRDACAP